MNSHWLTKKLANQRACKNMIRSKINYYRRLTLVGTKKWRQIGREETAARRYLVDFLSAHRY